MHLIRRHKGQECGQIGELEIHERAPQEGIETVVVVVTVAPERHRAWIKGV